jgi:O-antigen/teichoic acid export membrane protein
MGIGLMRLLSFPASLLCSMILARMLGPTRYGQYAFIMALVPLLALPAAGGIPRLLTREVANFSHTASWALYRGILRFGYGWVALYSVLLVGAAALFFLLSGAAATDSKWQLLPAATLLVPLLGVIAVLNGATKGLGFVALSEAPAQIIRPFAFLVVVSILAVYGRLTPELAIGGQIAAAGVASAAAAYFLRRRQPGGAQQQPAASAIHVWSAMLVPITFIALVGTLNSQIGIVLLGLLSKDESVAALQLADSGAKLVALSLTIVNMVIGPQIVKYKLANDKKGLQQLSRQSARSALLIAAPIALVFFVFGESLIALVFGAQYVELTFWPLAILALGQLISVFFGSVAYLLTMSGHEQTTLTGQIVALGVNVVACSILIPRYGAVGAALGVTAGLVVFNIILGAQVYRRLGIRPTAV